MVATGRALVLFRRNWYPTMEAKIYANITTPKSKVGVSFYRLIMLIMR